MGASVPADSWHPRHLTVSGASDPPQRGRIRSKGELQIGSREIVTLEEKGRVQAHGESVSEAI